MLRFCSVVIIALECKAICRTLPLSAAELEDGQNILPPDAVRWAESDSSPSPAYSEARYRVSAQAPSIVRRGRWACPNRAELHTADLPFGEDPQWHPALPLRVLQRAATAGNRKGSLEHVADTVLEEALQVDMQMCPSAPFPPIRHPAPRGRPLRKAFSTMSVQSVVSPSSQEGGISPVDRPGFPAAAAGPPGFPGRPLRRYEHAVREESGRDFTSPKGHLAAGGRSIDAKLGDQVCAGNEQPAEGWDTASWPAWRSNLKVSSAALRRHSSRAGPALRRPESAPCISSLLKPTSVRQRHPAGGDEGDAKEEHSIKGGAGPQQVALHVGNPCEEDPTSASSSGAENSTVQFADWTMFVKQLRGYTGGPLELIARLPSKRNSLPKATSMRNMPYVLKEPYPPIPSDRLHSNICSINALIASRRRALSKSGIADVGC